MAKEANHDEPNSRRDIRRVDPGFEPVYQLQERDYFRIINELSNLILESVETLKITGKADPARLISERASCLLTSYDSDVAELVGNAGRSQPESSGRRK
jgi:hypothetical protein